MFSTNFFWSRKKTPAEIAKKRLEIIISERRIKQPNFIEPFLLAQLKKDLLQIMKKYTKNPEILSIQLEQKNERISTLICNILFLNNNI